MGMVEAVPSVVEPKGAVTVRTPGEPNVSTMRRRFVPDVELTAPIVHVYTTVLTVAVGVLVGILASMVHTRAAQDDVSVKLAVVGEGVGVGVGAPTPGSRCTESRRLGVFGSSRVRRPTTRSPSNQAATASGMAVLATPRCMAAAPDTRGRLNPRTSA